MFKSDKPHKIKKYSNKTNFFPGGPRFGWLKILVSILVVVGLIFLGISLYNPIKEFIKGDIQPDLPIESETQQVEPPPKEEPDPQPVPEVEEKKPQLKPVVAAELPIGVAANYEQLEGFLANLDPQVNTVVINIKDNQGNIYFNSENTLANDWEAIATTTVDIPSLKIPLAERDLQLGVIFNVFSDSKAARGNLDNAILHTSGVIWLDNALGAGGKPWVTPYSAQVQSYNTSLVKELADEGVDLIILDSFYFPADPTGSSDLRATDKNRADLLNDYLSAFQESATTAEIGCMENNRKKKKKLTTNWYIREDNKILPVK